VDVSDRRASADAATCFRRAIAATGVAPAVVTTDRAPASPSALDAVLPTARHEAGEQVPQRIERDHRHLKGRVRGMRSFKTLAGARVLCRAHGFRRNLRGGFHALGQPATAAQALSASALLHTGAALTTALAAR